MRVIKIFIIIILLLFLMNMQSKDCKKEQEPSMDEYFFLGLISQSKSNYIQGILDKYRRRVIIILDNQTTSNQTIKLSYDNASKCNTYEVQTILPSGEKIAIQEFIYIKIEGYGCYYIDELYPYSGQKI
ncbi:MAG: hypothetical protein KatS3mg129_3178 [Leptospiraceae bacterium]|nr:MAG: hypothetical protein KatS3mg129_3178 [Leptospiraceae bacterium]